MRPDDAVLLVKLCRARAALRVEPEKSYQIETRLAPLARREGFSSIDEMFDVLRAKREEPLINAIVEAMASCDTAFFRDITPFERFRQEMLPTLARARQAQPIRIWSAGCGTGQETYSLAMAVEEMRFQTPEMRVEIFGSDLSERCLEKAQSGLYTQFEIQRGLPVRSLLRHFEKQGDAWAISPRVRQMVRWRRVNLAADLRGVGPFDVVFFRNVLRQMDPGLQRQVLEMVAMTVAPDGYLVLGEGELPSAPSRILQSLGDGVHRIDPAFRAAA